mmetsp:Transcript_35598/g.110245  ORF Transcript_35598/g.110245 Transcript_35598/m.110245 type:complete len:246 (-) Transcript_35598:105-842(-)
MLRLFILLCGTCSQLDRSLVNAVPLGLATMIPAVQCQLDTGMITIWEGQYQHYNIKTSGAVVGHVVAIVQEIPIDQRHCQGEDEYSWGCADTGEYWHWEEDAFPTAFTLEKIKDGPAFTYDCRGKGEFLSADPLEKVKGGGLSYDCFNGEWLQFPLDEFDLDYAKPMPRVSVNARDRFYAVTQGDSPIVAYLHLKARGNRYAQQWYGVRGKLQHAVVGVGEDTIHFRQSKVPAPGALKVHAIDRD